MFKKSKNKSFNYIPRFSGNNSIGNEEKSFPKQDAIQNTSINFKKNKSAKKTLPTSVLLLLLVLLLILMLILDSYSN